MVQTVEAAWKDFKKAFWSKFDSIERTVVQSADNLLNPPDTLDRGIQDLTNLVSDGATRFKEETGLQKTLWQAFKDLLEAVFSLKEDISKIASNSSLSSHQRHEETKKATKHARENCSNIISRADHAFVQQQEHKEPNFVSAYAWEKWQETRAAQRDASHAKDYKREKKS